MVKRPKSPEADEDEKYFTIYQPYPLNANWELPSDYIAFSRWIAACIGTDPLHALHYKPSAGGMVLIEVHKQYPHNERLLGEHRWSEFLKNPTDEEAGRVTQIFHCLYKTGREAQKDGWKRIHVESSWFKGWSPHETIQDPYPVTYWCSTPPEDKTNKSLCRPLPVKDKPPPETLPPPPVVGSSSWVSAKQAPSQNTPQALKGAWAKKTKKGGMQVATKNQSAGRSGASPAPAPSPSAWNKPITQNTPSTARPSPSSANVTPSANQWNKQSTQKITTPSDPSTTGPPNQASTYPPGLASRSASGQTYFPPPGLVRKSDSDSTATSGSGSGLEAKHLEDLFEAQVTISLSPSQDRELYGLALDHSPELGADVIHPWEATVQEDFPVVENLWVESEQKESEQTNLWGEETVVKKPTVALCPHHQHLCKKGVCIWRAKQVREEEKLAALAAKIDKGNGKGGRGKKSGGWRKNPNTPSGNNSGEGTDGFSVAGRGGRNKGRHMGAGRGRDKQGGDDDASSSVGGSYNDAGGFGKTSNKAPSESG